MPKKLHVMIRGYTQSRRAVYLKIYTDDWEDQTEPVAKSLKMYYRDGLMRMPYIGTDALIFEILRKQTCAEIVEA